MCVCVCGLGGKSGDLEFEAQRDFLGGNFVAYVCVPVSGCRRMGVEAVGVGAHRGMN